MSADQTSDSAKPAFISSVAQLGIAAGILVLIGWAFDIAAFKSILPVWVSMKANTAACFLLIGVALLLITRQSPIRNPRPLLSLLARFFSLLAGLIGLLTLAEYIFGWDVGIDQWLINEPEGTMGTSHPGRMAPETALNFILLAVALWLTNRAHKTRRSILISVVAALLVAVFALSALMSYLTPGLGAFGWFGLTIMAVHTSILFTMLGIAVIAASWQPEVLSWSFSGRTTAAFVCVMALLVFIGLSTNRSQFWMKETNRQILYAEEMQSEVANILVEIVDAKVHSRNYIITGDEQYLKAYLQAEADSTMQLDALGRVEFVANNPLHQQHFARIEAQVKAQFLWFKQAIETNRAGMTDTARNHNIRLGEELLDKLRNTVDQVQSEHHQLIRQLKQDARNVSRFSYLVIFTGTLTSLLIFLVAIFRLNDAESERAQKEQALKNSEEALRVSNERFELAVAGTNDGIWDWNISSNTNYFSPRFMELLGYAPDELAAELRTFEALLHPDDLAWVFDRVRQHLENNIPYNVEYRLRTKQGRYKWFQARGKAILDASGKPFRMAGSITDITERKQTEEKIKEQLDYLERFRKVAVKREFRIRELMEAAENMKARIAEREKP